MKSYISGSTKTNFNQIWCEVTYHTLRQLAKSDDNNACFPSKLLNSIWLFYFTVYKLNINQGTPLTPRNCRNRTITFQEPRHQMCTPVHIADFLPNKSVNLWNLVLKFWENIFVMTALFVLYNVLQYLNVFSASIFANCESIIYRVRLHRT